MCVFISLWFLGSRVGGEKSCHSLVFFSFGFLFLAVTDALRLTLPSQISDDEGSDQEDSDQEDKLTKQLNADHLMLSDTAIARQDKEEFSELLEKSKTAAAASGDGSAVGGGAAAAAAASAASSAALPASGATTTMLDEKSRPYLGKELIINRVVDGRVSTVRVTDPRVIAAYNNHTEEQRLQKRDRKAGRQPAMAPSDDDDYFLGDEETVARPGRAPSITAAASATAKAKRVRPRRAATGRARARADDYEFEEEEDEVEPELMEDEDEAAYTPRDRRRDRDRRASSSGFSKRARREPSLDEDGFLQDDEVDDDEGYLARLESTIEEMGLWRGGGGGRRRRRRKGREAENTTADGFASLSHSLAISSEQSARQRSDRAATPLSRSTPSLSVS